MKVEPCYTDGVKIPQRLRALDPAKVDRLAESMAALGLLQPICVFMTDKDSGDTELVAGRHRLAAAQKLGWDKIDAVFLDGWSDIDRQLAEIDENLMRSELTPTQQAEHLAKRKELWEARASESGKASPTLTGRGNTGFASDTAKKTGTSKRSINQAIARAEGIPQDVRDRITGTKLDTGVYMDRLKGRPENEQRAMVERDLERLARPTPKVPKTPPVQIDADERQLEALQGAWNRASSEARRRFKDWLEEQEEPVFDRGAA